MSSNSKIVRCALSVSSVSDITEAINNAIDNKFTYLICPLVNPRFKREYLAENLDHQQLPLTRSDLDLSAECKLNTKIEKNYFSITRLAKLCCRSCSSIL